MDQSINRPNRKKQLITGVVTAIFLLIIFAGVLPGLGDYEDAFKEIKSMSSAAIVLLSFVTLVNVLAYVLPYMASLPKLRYGAAFMVRQTSFLISNSVPGGGAFGVGIQFSMLRDYGFKASKSSSAVVLTTAWNILLTISLPGIAAFGLLLTGQLDTDSFRIAIFSIMAAVISIAGFTLIIKSESIARKIGKYLENIIRRLFRAIKLKRTIKLVEPVLSFRESTYTSIIKRWHLLAGSNLLQHLMQFLVLYTALHILDPGVISIATALWAFAVARLGTFIPLTPGGIGTVDAILVTLLTEVGVSSDIALAATLIWRFATFIPQIVVGLITFLYWRWAHTHGKYNFTKFVEA